MKDHDSLPVSPRRGASPFTEIAAVEAWDAWFRWREQGTLRDLTVDATWDRVATALVSIESPESAQTWKKRLTAALRTWQLLPDERILATAGTRTRGWDGDHPIAVLNAACFVRAAFAPDAVFDATEFENVGALATRMLDNAILLVGNGPRVGAGFRIGIIGVADALAALGLEFDSCQARAQATSMARALARGCTRGSLLLALERGATAAATESWRSLARARGIAADVIDEVSRIGIRHSQLTAITSQPKLAKFANDVSNALDPCNGFNGARAPMGRDFPRTPGTEGRPSLSPMLRSQSAPDRVTPAGASATAQQELRACIQLWIDEPIDYPLAAVSGTRTR